MTIKYDTSHKDDNQVIDPDPMSVFLGVMGFLGSVASIAGYVEFKRDQRRQYEHQRTKNLREARDLLMSLEADVMQVEASLHKLEFVLIEGTTEHHSMPLSKLRLEFGSCKPLFTLHGFRKYEEIMQELNRLVGKSFETTSQLLQRLYNLDVHIPEAIYQKLIELQNRLNQVLREGFTYEEGFRIYYDLIIFTRNIIREIRNVLNRQL